MTCGSNRRRDGLRLGTNSGRKSNLSSLGSSAIGACVLSLTGAATPGISGAGTGGTIGVEAGTFGTAGAACAPGTPKNEKKSFAAENDGAPENGAVLADSRKYAVVPGTAGG